MDKEAAAGIAQRKGRLNKTWQHLVAIAENYPIEFNAEIDAALKLLHKKGFHLAGVALSFAGMKVAATIIQRLAEKENEEDKEEKEENKEALTN